MRHSLAAFAIALLFWSCQKDQWDDCFTSTGSKRTETRTVPAFTQVELHDRIDLELIDAPAGAIEVEGGGNLLGQISAEVEDGVLRIEDRNTCNWVRRFDRRITVRIPAASVATLTVRGTGNVTARTTIQRNTFELQQRGAQGSIRLDLDVDTCYLKLNSGAGDLVCTGHAYRADLFSGSFGFLDATGLDVQQAYVNNSGTVDIRCRATEALFAYIHDSGDVYYAGHPQAIYPEITGSGHLIALE